VVATIAKPDGSGNTTVLEYKPIAALRIMTTAPLAKFKFAEGDYIVSVASLFGCNFFSYDIDFETLISVLSYSVPENRDFW
jgi:hypothetical protein